MFVPGSDSKDLLSVMYYWNKARMASCQVTKVCNEYAHE